MTASSGPDICFDFWGTSVEVFCCAADVKELGFFYRSFLSEAVVHPDVSVSLECLSWPARGLMASTLAGDSLTKRIQIRDNLDPHRSTTTVFRKWSGLASPFPPLGTATLIQRLATAPGAVLALRNGQTAVIVGENYVGKTSTVIELCVNHGARLISDSLVVLDIERGVCLPYETPLGIRGRTLERSIQRIEGLEHRLTVSIETGLVALVQPQALLGRPNAREARIDCVVVMQTGDVARPRLLTVSVPRLPWFTEASVERIDERLPARALRAVFPSELGPTDRAESLARRLESGAV